MGLLEANGDEKPAWRQLSALMQELHDDSARGGQGRAPPLDVALDGELAHLESLLFAKGDGSYRVVLGLETPSVDPVSARAVEVASQKVTVKLPAGFRARRFVTCEPSGAPSVRSLTGDAAKLAIDDNLSIVDIAR